MMEEPWVRLVRYWDKGATQGGGSRTAGVLMGLTGTGLYCVIDVVKGQWNVHNREKMIKQTAEADLATYGLMVETWIEQEPGGGGKESALSTIKNLAGLRIRADRPTVSKELRFDPFASQAEAGHVRVFRAPWNWEYIDELLSFPNGTFKDQCDATSGAFKILTRSRTKKVYHGSVAHI